jgi:hypothetical protein
MLRDNSSFFEAEISLSTVHRLTDDDVVKHLDLKNPGSFAEPTRDAEISFTGGLGPLRGGCVLE